MSDIGRAPDAAGLAAWEAQISSGAMTAAQVAAAFTATAATPGQHAAGGIASGWSSGWRAQNGLFWTSRADLPEQPNAFDDGFQRQFALIFEVQKLQSQVSTLTNAVIAGDRVNVAATQHGTSYAK